MTGWQAEEDQILLKAKEEGRNVKEVRRIHRDKKHKTIKKVL